MKTIALIPARYGSTRFPGKPLALVRGKPLIQRVYEQALQVKELDALWVATDDAAIRACVESFGGKAVLTREDHRS
ncbi:MAG: 3-deoxy-manno-octulosonate cytidylyltransferase, partial [Syntrophales bacterium]|nr:3-deoxy-manno-octulosonate cytidylyltransferase [Syntrophales bacterium]